MAKLLTSNALKNFALVSAACIALAACGRGGAPLKPSEAAAVQAKQDGVPAPEKPVPNASNPDKRFILDGLID